MESREILKRPVITERSSEQMESLTNTRSKSIRVQTSLKSKTLSKKSSV